MSEHFLFVRGLRVRIGDKDILNGVDFALNESVSVGVVGESGSGKTMFARSVIGLLPEGAEASGTYEIEGAPFDLNAKEREWRRVRGCEIGMIMQDPFTALEPLTKCGKQILAGVPASRRSAFDVAAALDEVGLDAHVAERYPFELSGGMRQRVVIAAALATGPKLLIADEATTALDVITQSEILDLIDEIKARRGMPLIIITHDIKLIYQRTDRVVVMESGRIVEKGPTRSVIEHPREEYTKKLVAADRFLSSGAYPEYAVGGAVILKVEGLVKKFGAREALSDVSIEVGAGECVGIVGESGSGKTTLARCIVGLTQPDAGTVKYFGSVNPQIVFQDPYSSLNPAHTVRYILEEALAAAGRPADELSELLRLSEIPEELLDRRPANLSGGQRQRVAIARALAPRPELLICDESVSALDTIIQNQILATIERLRKERGLAVLFITHDLSVVRVLAGRVYVMHDAKIVNEGPTGRIFEGTDDDYTRRLIAASALGAPDGGSAAAAGGAWESGDVGAFGSSASSPADVRGAGDAAASVATLFKNAAFYTVAGEGWEGEPREAMAVGADGRILFVGSEEEARAALDEAGLCYAERDLGGRAVLPGFVDTHVHMPGSALTELYEIYLYECRDLAGTLDLIREFVAAHPDRDAYYGTGFYMSITDEPCGPRREWLDEIEAEKPIVLNSSDGHSYWLNTAALRALGIDAGTRVPEGGLICKDPATGEPTGTVTDVEGLITLCPRYGNEECKAALRAYQEKQLAWGYTAAMHIAPHFCPVGALKELDEAGEWRMRVNLSSLAETDAPEPVKAALAEADSLRADFAGSGLVRVTAVKFFEDGVVEGKTAFLKAPYAEGAGTPEGYRSAPLWSQDDLTDAFAEIARAGYQIHVHAIGDAAVSETLAALRAARERGAGQGGRDVLTHLQLLGDEEIRAMRELDVIASFQPFWHFKEPFWYEEIDLALLGEERAESAYPVGSVLRGGVRVTFSGDYPASPVNDPFWAIQIAVTRNLADPGHYGVEQILSPGDEQWLRNADERISLKEAIEAYTISGAYQLFREDEIGSLEPGKQADFIVLTDDPFRADPVCLYRIKVKETYIAGRAVFSS